MTRDRKNATVSKSTKPAQPAARRIRDARRSAKPRRAGAGSVERNAYLESLLNPEYAHDARVPDDSCLPSATFHTQRSFDLSTNADGRACYVLGPNYVSLNHANQSAGIGAIKLGVTVGSTEGELVLAEAGSPDLDPSNPGCTTFQVMTSDMKTQIAENFAAIRVVSACLKIVPIAAAMTASGALATGLVPRGEFVGRLDCGAASPANGLDAFFTTRGAQSIDDVFSGPENQVTNATVESCVTWFPQDAVDNIYKPTLAGARQGTFAVTTCLDTVTGNINRFYAPFALEAGAVVNSTSNTGGTQLPDTTFSTPYFVVAIKDAPATTKTHTATLTINYEAIPLTNVSMLTSSEPSPANPLELAQATNTVRNLPNTRYALPGDAPTHMYEAATAAAAHLSTRGPVKSVVEGRSFLDEIKKGATSVGKWVKSNSGFLMSAGSALLSLL